MDEDKQEVLTTDNLELKRVQSWRMEQEDKVTSFLKKESVLYSENQLI